MGKDYKHILAALKEQGWRLESTSDSHIKAYPPDKDRPLVCFAITSGDPRAIKNTIRDLRASGFDWPPASQRPSSPSNEPEEAPMSEPVYVGAPEAPEGPQKTPDQLFLELKEARNYAALAKEALRDSKTAFEKAQSALKGSEEEYARAVEQMNLCKRQFDKAFDAKEL